MSVASAPTETYQLSVAAKAISKLPAIRPSRFGSIGAFSGAMAIVATGLGYPIVLWVFEFTSMESRLPPTSIARDARRGQGRSSSATTAER
jgi:hypothetical protein